jgi:hypothetical protein
MGILMVTPKPPFVVQDTAAYSGGGLKSAKYLITRRVDNFYIGVGYFVSKSKVDMLTVHDRDFASRRYVVTTDDVKKFTSDVVSLAKTKGGSTEAFLLLGEKHMAKLSRRAAPEPEVEEEEEAPAPRARRAAPAPTPKPRRAAAPPPEPEEPEEEEEEEEEEEAPAAPAAKARRAAKPAPPPPAPARGRKPAPAPEPSPVGRAKYADTDRIKVLIKPHGARDGTIRAELLDNIYASKTVGDAVDAGVKRADVTWAARAGYIDIV